MKKEPVSRTIYYESSEKLSPKWIKWIDKNSVSHTFADGKGEIVLKDSVRKIEQYAFDDVKKISEGEIEICNEIMTSIVIPDSITEIEFEAFFNCISLKSVVIPDSVTKIEAVAFFWCTSLRSIIIPDSVTEIGVNAFGMCRGLKSVVIPKTITEISYALFRGCTNLESVVIPDSVTKIEESAFYECENLRSIVIPDSVTEIEKFAFYGCDKLPEETKEKILSINPKAFDEDV